MDRGAVDRGFGVEWECIEVGNGPRHGVGVMWGKRDGDAVFGATLFWILRAGFQPEWEGGLSEVYPVCVWFSR